MNSSKSYRAIKAPDHASPGDFSWIVFDITRANANGEFTYVADCINAASARLVADALNEYMKDRSRRRRRQS